MVVESMRYKRQPCAARSDTRFRLNRWSKVYVRAFGKKCSCGGPGSPQNQNLAECHEIHAGNRLDNRYTERFLQHARQLLSIRQTGEKLLPFGLFGFERCVPRSAFRAIELAAERTRVGKWQ